MTKRKIACFQFTSNSIQFATSLEILDLLNSEYDSGYYFWWGSSTRYPSRMNRGYYDLAIFPLFRLKIRRRVKTFLQSFSVRFSSRIRVKPRQIKEQVDDFLKQVSLFTDIKQLQTVVSNGIAPGSALANAYVSETGSRTFDFQKHRHLIRLLLESYVLVFNETYNLICEEEIDTVLIYNGRFLHERAVWDAAKKANIKTLVFETTRNRYHLRQDKGFHDRIVNQQWMLENWKELLATHSKAEVLAWGQKYFKELESSRNIHYRNAVFQKPIKPYFAFFSNSDDEAVGFWETWSESFMDQVELLSELQKYFESQNIFHLVIRLHPNLKSKGEWERSRWSTIASGRNCTVIDADSAVSSYEILKNASGVISFGSTIGLEAAFNRIPSCVLADCWYDELGAADKLFSFEALLHWIEIASQNISEEEMEQRFEASLVRGLWLEKAGRNFRQATMTELSWGAWEVEKIGSVKLTETIVLRSLSILTNRFVRKCRGLGS